MQVSMKAMRVNANLTQSAVSEAIGITEKTLQNWESGYSAPDAIQFARLCNLYGCSRDDIFLPDNLAKREM